MKNIVPFVVLCLFVLTGHDVAAGLLKDQAYGSEGLKRTYDLYLPDNRPGSKSPLVLLLHGHMGDADVMTGENRKKAPYKLWLKIAEREGWMVLIPDGEWGSDKHRGWNDCRADAKTNPKLDDVTFLTALIDSVATRYPVDTKRLYAHGTSNGGNMVYRLAQESGGRFRAMAAVVAAMPEHNKCRAPEYPVSILIMNGVDDPILPYEGGAVGRRKSDKRDRGSVLSTEQTVAYWVKRNGISDEPVVIDLPDVDTSDGSRIRLIRCAGGKNDTEVVLYEVLGGGHTEPSLSQHYGRLYRWIVGPQNRDVEMAEEVWKFFERHR